MPAASPLPSGGRDRRSLVARLTQGERAKRALRARVVTLVLSPARGDSGFNRFVRYSVVSGAAIVISQAAILVCTLGFHFSGILSNTIGALAATPASYELNRKWAWGKSGKSHLWREVVPFWSLSLVGYLASTGTVELADAYAKSHHVTGVSRSVLIMGASLFAYGVIWVVKFVVFNRLFVSAEAAGQEGPLVDGGLGGPGVRP